VSRCRCGSYAVNDDENRTLCDKCWRDKKIVSLTQQLSEAQAALDNAKAWNEYVRTQSKCEWTWDETRQVYATSCDHAWMFIDDGLAENGLKFCPFCGGFVREAKAVGGGE
jgi:hypothetical protein